MAPFFLIQVFILLVAFIENNKVIRKVCLSQIYFKKKTHARYLKFFAQSSCQTEKNRYNTFAA